jgi:hypothetical protein
MTSWVRRPLSDRIGALERAVAVEVVELLSSDRLRG